MGNNIIYTDKYSYPNYPHVVVKDKKVVQVLFFEAKPDSKDITSKLDGVDYDVVLDCSVYGMAYIGYEWHEPFLTLPKPYPSSILDNDGIWKAPIPMPVDGNIYYWDEATYSWVKIELS